MEQAPGDDVNHSPEPFHADVPSNNEGLPTVPEAPDDIGLRPVYGPMTGLEALFAKAEADEAAGHAAVAEIFAKAEADEAAGHAAVAEIFAKAEAQEAADSATPAGAPAQTGPKASDTENATNDQPRESR